MAYGMPTNSPRRGLAPGAIQAMVKPKAHQPGELININAAARQRGTARAGWGAANPTVPRGFQKPAPKPKPKPKPGYGDPSIFPGNKTPHYDPRIPAPKAPVGKAPGGGPIASIMPVAPPAWQTIMQDPSLLGSLSDSQLALWAQLAPAIGRYQGLGTRDPQSQMTPYEAMLRANQRQNMGANAALASNALSRGMYGLSNVVTGGMAQNAAAQASANANAAQGWGPGAIKRLEDALTSGWGQQNFNSYDALQAAQNAAYGALPGWTQYGQPIATGGQG